MEHAEDCGCRFTFVRDTVTPGSSQLVGPDKISVTRCPTHKAAPQMLRALEKLAEDARAYPYDPLGSLDHLDEIIAQARGQEAGT